MTRDSRTFARIKSILKTNKPLREKYVPGITSAQLRKGGSPKPSLLSAFFGGGVKDKFCGASGKAKPAINDNHCCPSEKKQKKQGPNP